LTQSVVNHRKGVKATAQVRRRPGGRLASVDGLEQVNVPGRITFISHAPTAALVRAAFPVDEPIEPREVEKLGLMDWIPPRARQIYAGPEQRTRQTANALGLNPILSAELRDLDYSSWRGRSLDDIQASDLESVRRWLTDIESAPHGGESVATLLTRVDCWLAGQQYSGHTVAVTHPAVIRAAIILALRAPAQSFWRVDIPPASITDLRWTRSSWSVRCSGCRIS
jgi:broad specificity phosphatase PhoE